MGIDEAVAQILAEHLPRVQVKAGNGLTRNMNNTIRTYQQIPIIIRRTVSLLARMESLCHLSGAVKIHGIHLYKMLIDCHDDWVKDVPRLGVGGLVSFYRKPVVPYHQFAAAWTIARRIRLLAGRGKIGLHPNVLTQLNQSLAVSQEAISNDEQSLVAQAPRLHHAGD